MKIEKCSSFSELFFIFYFKVLVFYRKQVSGFIRVETMKGKWMPLIGHVNHASECPVAQENK